jgi:hypothetical protein
LTGDTGVSGMTDLALVGLVRGTAMVLASGQIVLLAGVEAAALSAADLGFAGATGAASDPAMTDALL